MSSKMNLCTCGCGSLTYGKFVRGHQLSTNPIAESVIPEPVTAAHDAPPQSGPIDHRRFRLAAERPATPPTNPWIETKCHNCLAKMWTRDPTSTWENAGVCEECQYLLVSEFHDQGRQQFARQARTFHDPFPFRPR